MNRDQTIRGRQMTKKTMRRGAVGAISVALLGGALAMTPAQADEPTFAVTTSDSSVAVGDEVTVTVAAENVQDVFAYELALDFDPAVLSYEADSASTDVTGSTYASVQGDDLVVLHTKLGTSPAAKGDVSLVSATFTARKAGTATLAVPSLKLVGTGGEARTVEVEGASVAVDRIAAPTAVTAPKVSGSPQVGKVLAVSPGTWSVKGVSTRVQWLRNGKAIAGATRSTYRLAPADFRAAISARVTASKADHADGTAVAKAISVTRKAVSRTGVKVPGSVKAKATFKARVSVKASGVSPKGTIRVYVGGRLVKKNVKVSNGTATVWLRVAKKGRSAVRFVYVPQSGVEGSHRTVKVRVR
ncbi:cohesin domain-containing protein [Aeromicrobium choanae]|uniref:Cohesin domain-containing protein n=1 Tax=Aeromicrobium choanae TaxID=1736691 RepID=A0A1T4YZV2_9ACTN|nr:cohesin domain-containing protein [Aeromicrobium choanae]SKB07266.1 Cohesin domain-containing protein [Aeromicrobium choanae]